MATLHTMPSPMAGLMTTTSLSASGTSLITATLSTITTTATGQPGLDRPSPAGTQDECRLLGPFALVVQATLGALALLVLVYKRWRERPQRPVKIWFFDASKQVFGSVLVHIVNVFMSMLTLGHLSIKLSPEMISSVSPIVARLVGRLAARHEEDGYVPNPCSFYLLNLAIDTTLGIPILISLVWLFTIVAGLTSWGQPPESIQSGFYGSPPRAWWWLKQSVLYFCGLFGMKLGVLVLFLLLPWLSRVGDWALGWTEGNEKLQIVFVMMLFPLIMNAMQYYIIDSFIKKRTPNEDGAAAADADNSHPFEGQAEERRRLARTSSDEQYGVASRSQHPDKGRYRPPSPNEFGDQDDDSEDDDSLKLLRPYPARRAQSSGSGASSASGALNSTSVLSTGLYPKE